MVAFPPDRSALWARTVEESDPVEVRGRITRVVGLLVESSGPAAGVGELCALAAGDALLGMAEVVGFREGTTLLMPLGGMDGIRPGLEVVATGKPLTVPVGPDLVGRVLDGLGNPLDGKGPVAGLRRPVTGHAPHPLTRHRIDKPMGTGVRALDGFLTLARGQRMGIFAGSGVGKSVLLGMLARRCEAEINVICLIGERGREVREFLERDLGEEGMKRSVVVCATSDQPAVVRVKAAFTATAIAEWFRERGRDVLLMMDSATRLAMAQREIGLAVGEPPATKGYTPSVFALLPKIFERAGTSETGSITGLYTVLVDETRAGISRDAFLDVMTEWKIGVGVHYLSIPEHPYYQRAFGWMPEDYPNAMRIGRQTVSLPLSPGLTDEDVDDVIAAVKTVMEQGRR